VASTTVRALFKICVQSAKTLRMWSPASRARVKWLIGCPSCQANRAIDDNSAAAAHTPVIGGGWGQMDVPNATGVSVRRPVAL